MAARISASAVDFAIVATKIPAAQKNAFMGLKGKVEVKKGLNFVKIDLTLSTP